MRRPRLVWRILGAFLLVTLPALALVAWHAGRLMHDQERAEARKALLADARLLRDWLSAVGGIADPPAVDRLCRAGGRSTGVRFTVVDASGAVLGDSEERPDRMENHLARPEVQRALAGREGSQVRHSRTVHRDTLYLAVPYRQEGRVVAAIRAAMPLGTVDRAVTRLWRRLALGGGIVASLAVLLSLFLAWRINRPLREMQQSAERFAAGDLSLRLPVPDHEETGALASALNQMAATLGERLATITRQRNELAAFLESMAEAVLVLDRADRLERWNPAAETVLGVRPGADAGRALAEVLRQADLLRYVESLRAGKDPAGLDLTLSRDGNRHLQVSGSLIRDESGPPHGVLLVFHDVTRLRALERVRTDFVANVSHELRTPITSIHGFVETLRDGALEDPEAARRFLDIVAQQTGRLGAIIDDLLSLARLEQTGGVQTLRRERAALDAVVEAAKVLCSSRMAERQIAVEVVGEPGITAEMNAPLLEQALVNLIDNAVKYSPVGGTVTVRLSSSDTEVTIAVEDHGAGIPSEHLPRIFERFYRVDKARSRELGGTGLGLAIVRHIVAAHGGEVGVRSVVGEGSVFTVRLPRG
jgi:two-component system phosphate regulon sensor histidine kinase PhoR